MKTPSTDTSEGKESPALAPAPKDAPPWVADIVDQILRDALEKEELSEVLASLCERLVARGFPLWRTSMAMRTIDPTIRAFSLVWRPGTHAALDTTPYDDDGVGEAQYERSPIAYMFVRGLRVHAWRLDQGEGCDTIPLLADLRDEGATHYVMHLIRFGGPTSAALPGVAFGVATDRAGGFSSSDLEALLALLPSIGLAANRFSLTRTASDLLGVYLGPMTAQRVLAGEVHRGTGRAITAPILIADLRGFTTLVGREQPLSVVRWLDEYLEAIGGSLSVHGGEVLKFLGDGLLATFPSEETDADRACRAALAAAREALARTATLNRARHASQLPELALDVVLHHGEVVYGNVGAARRLDFTVIGRAVNEASRIEGLCEQLGHNLLLSATFAARCGEPTISLGRFRLRGIVEELEVLTPVG
jgi:adenylate cyclase